MAGSEERTGPGFGLPPNASSVTRTVRKLRRANARFEDSIWGDLVGGLCVMALGYLLFVIAGVLQ